MPSVKPEITRAMRDEGRLEPPFTTANGRAWSSTMVRSHTSSVGAGLGAWLWEASACWAAACLAPRFRPFTYDALPMSAVTFRSSSRMPLKGSSMAFRPAALFFPFPESSVRSSRSEMILLWWAIREMGIDSSCPSALSVRENCLWTMYCFLHVRLNSDLVIFRTLLNGNVSSGRPSTKYSSPRFHMDTTATFSLCQTRFTMPTIGRSLTRCSSSVPIMPAQRLKEFQNACSEVVSKIIGDCRPSISFCLLTLPPKICEGLVFT
mmetsp:Transcript_106781/g.184189  ORF Transcript_106781/g.184189 Transcript_106781/m.184189 type:complete len:264 (-) Transcript_106781:216-1007(-)